MKVSEFKDICEALGKFATTREKAVGSESKIGVQVSNGVLKFIASSDSAGIIVTAGPHEGKFAYAVDARPFLQSAKALPSKQDMTIEVAQDGLTIVAQGGGKVRMKPTGGLDVFTRKPKEFRAKAEVKKGQWPQIARLFKAVSNKLEVPGVQVVNGTAHAVAVAPGNRSSYVSIAIPGATGPDGYAASATLDFWDGLRAIEADGTLEFGKSGMIARSGTVEVYSAPHLVAKYDAASGTPLDAHEPPAWPLMQPPDGMSVKVTLPRRDFITVLKGQAPFDAHNRVTLDVKGSLMSVSAFASDTEQTVPVVAVGKGRKSVRSDYLTGILSNMDGKEVTLEWGSGSHAVSITSEDHAGWTILLAPVAI